jgi:hypothetical protein
VVSRETWHMRIRKQLQGDEKPEKPANFCGRCREWVTSSDKVGLFSVVDSAQQTVAVWICENCKKREPKMDNMQVPGNVANTKSPLGGIQDTEKSLPESPARAATSDPVIPVSTVKPVSRRGAHFKGRVLTQEHKAAMQAGRVAAKLKRSQS